MFRFYKSFKANCSVRKYILGYLAKISIYYR